MTKKDFIIEFVITLVLLGLIVIPALSWLVIHPKPAPVVEQKVSVP